MNPEASDAEVLRGMIPELEAEGYDVFLHPRPPLVPAFLGSFRPDAIAIRSDKKLLVEVISGSDDDKKLEPVRGLLKDQPSWELRIVLVSPVTVSDSLEVQTPGAIRQRIAEMEKLIEEGHAGPAFLLGWASFEAASRKLLVEQFRKPQTPGRLVDVLASGGYLTPSEADRLRALAKKRNAFVHGELGAEISMEDVRQLIAVLKTMLEMIDKGSHNI
jgi:hypothetical protein